MQRFIIFVIITIFFSTSIFSSEIIKKRHKWWQRYLTQIEKDQAKFKKDKSFDKDFISILSSDIKRGKKIISVFNSYYKNDGSLTDIKKKYSASEIDSIINKNLIPIFSIYYIKEIKKNIKSYNNLKVKDYIINSIDKIIEEKFKKSNKNLAKIIYKEKIDKYKITNFINNIYADFFILNKDEIYNKIFKRIRRDVFKLLKNEKNSHAFIEKNVRGLGLKYFIDNNHEKYFDNILLSFSNSKNLEILIPDLKSELEKLSMIQKITKTKSSISKIWFYRDNISYFKENYFNRKDINFILLKKITSSKKILNPTLKIPVMPDFISLADEIDKIRENYIAQNTPGKNSSFIYENFDEMLRKKINNVRDIFKVEEKKIGLKEVNNSYYTFAEINNYDEFKKAKELFNKKNKAIMKYKTKSILFIDLVYQINEKSNPGNFKFYKNILSKNLNYINFIKNLFLVSYEVYSYSDKNIVYDYKKSIYHSASSVRVIALHSSPSKFELAKMRKSELISIKNEIVKFKKKVKYILRDMRQSYNSFLINRKFFLVEEIEKDKNLISAIGQNEVDLIIESIMETVNQYKKLTYTDKILSEYSIIYNNFLLTINDGSPSEKLRSTIKKKSILNLIKDYRQDKIISENKKKSYLRSRGHSLIAKLVTLIYYYKKNNINIAEYSSKEERRVFKNKLDRESRMKISSWVMTDKNIEKIDSYLHKNLQKKIYIIDRYQKNNIKNSKVSFVRIGNIRLKVLIPSGWEKIVSGKTSNKDLIEIFESLNKMSSIKINAIPQEKFTIKNISEQWLKKNKSTPVEKKWDKKNNDEYYWVRSKKKNYIIESYSIAKNGYVFIISGKSKYNGYNFFKNKLKFFFRSMEFTN